MSKEGLRLKDLENSLYKEYANFPVTQKIRPYLLMKLEIHDERIYPLFNHALYIEL